MEVHGITDEFLADKPVYSQIVDDFMAFINGAQLVIHNAPFDVGFMDMEFGLLNGYPKTADICTVLDTLVLAREKHPGQRNSLDALCRRYGIDNSHRELHGALLDSEILADVYLFMTGGQTALTLEAESGGDGAKSQAGSNERILIDHGLAAGLSQYGIQADEKQSHAEFLELLSKKSEKVFWSN